MLRLEGQRVARSGACTYRIGKKKKKKKKPLKDVGQEYEMVRTIVLAVERSWE